MSGRKFISKGFVCFFMLLAQFTWPEVILAQQPVGTPASALVIVEWTTESEVNLAGFNLYRSDEPEGPYLKVNDALIPASHDPVTGGSYVYTDTAVTAGVTYYYKLEDVELDGSSTMHGPIEVVAQTDVGVTRFRIGGIVALTLLVSALVTVALISVAWRRRCRSAGGRTRVGPDE
jgi:hypothetical protein